MAVSWRRVANDLLIVTTLVAYALLLVLLFRRLLGAQLAEGVLLAAAGSFAFGALVGFTELLSRYRDEPLLAAWTGDGVLYVFLNGAISLAAFVVLRRYADAVLVGLKGELFLQSIVAGFGAMAVFRSKLFTFRSEDGQEYAIGPAIVLDTILRTVDRRIDRYRATKRQARVFAEMKDLRDFEAAAQYLEASLLSFQNLSMAEKEDISRVIDQYRRETDWPAALKLMAVGFAFLTIAGEENFQSVIKNLKAFLSQAAQRGGTPGPPPGGGGP